MATENLSFASKNSSQILISVQQPWVDTRFSVFDSDIEVQSSDGFIFQLHRLLLEVNTGAFPGSDIDTQGEIGQLTEPADVLALLFAFIYPKKFMDFEGRSFPVVAALAEAAEKYEVYFAMHICNVQLTKFLPQHAAEIFIYAVKHDYPKLINDTVPHFSRSPFVSILAKLPPAYVMPWALYYDAWTAVFKSAIHEIKKLESGLAPQCHSIYNRERGVCGTCQSSLFKLVTNLEDVDTESAIHEALESSRSKYFDLKCCRDGSSYIDRISCPHMITLTRSIHNKIKEIPSFSSFLNIQVQDVS